jgi:hypothetical protein
VALLSCAALAVAAPTAHAALNWDTASHNFGNQNVGTSSAPKTFTLTATCDTVVVGVCVSPIGGVHFFGNPAVTGEGFALGPPNTCAAQVLVTPSGGAAACTSTVVFTPTSAGAKTGSLTTPSGPDIALSGTGVAPAAPTAGGVAGKAKKCKKGQKLKKGKCVKKRKKKKR